MVKTPRIVGSDHGFLTGILIMPVSNPNEWIDDNQANGSFDHKWLHRFVYTPRPALYE